MPTTLTPPGTYVNASLKLANEALAIELALPESSSAVSGFLPRIFKNATAGLTAFIADKFDYFKARGLDLEQSKIEAKIKELGFDAAKDYKVTTLEGFDGNFTQYGYHILESFEYFDKFTDSELKHYKLLLGDILTNRSSRLDMRDITSRFKDSEKARDALNSENAKFFKQGSHVAIKCVGDFITDPKDLSETFKVSHDLILKIKSTDPQAVQNRVAEITELVEAVTEEIDNKHITELSKAQIKNLSDGILQLAFQIEFYALVNYRAVTYVTAVTRLTEELSNLPDAK